MQAVIMAGGQGTRLSQVTRRRLPKPMIPIAGKPVLEYQINCLRENGLREIWIVTGPLHEKIEDYFGNGEKWGVTLRYFHENTPMGTGGALYYLKAALHDDFLLLFGDIFFDMDLNRMIRFHQTSGALATLLVHPNSHPYDSDLVLLDQDGRITGIKGKKEPRHGYYRNMVNAGIYCLNAGLLEELPEPLAFSLEAGLIFPHIREGSVFGYLSTEYIRDIGTPERLFSAQEDWKKGIVTLRNRKHRQKCIFVDRDGTLNKYRGFIARPEDLELEDTVPEAVNMAHEKGYLVIVITNQPVVARNLCSLAGLEQIHNKLETLLGEKGAYLDGIRFCPHHPDRGYPGERSEYKVRCRCRKPEPGLIWEAAQEFSIDLSSSYMIGDTTTDIQTGINAGVKTVLLGTGEAGKDGKYPAAPDFRADNLLMAVQAIN